MGPDLIEALRTFPGGESFYLETQFGKPFTSTGFYNWFKRACVKAGIPHCSPTACARQRAAAWPKPAPPPSRAAP
jgi:hypothetical protein